MLPMRQAGVAWRGSASFAPVTERQIGNQLPGWTGSPGNTPDKPAPYPATQKPVGGNVGHFDGISGSDEWAPKIQPHPRRVVMGAEQENDRRYGIQGFNDRLQYRDRHAYWDRGRSRMTGAPAQVQNSGRNPQLDGKPRASLRLVNISINPQIGSDATRNQDDLTRPYTWLGQQDGTPVPVYGGVPGLYIEYGNRGLPQGIHDPTDGQGGNVQIYPGPPHGLHSETYPAGKLMLDRYKSTPQQRPGRIDRPDNSRIAGQSYSQTVQPQSMTGGQAPAAPRRGIGLTLKVGGRSGWAGAQDA